MPQFFDTICNATAKRQSEAVELSEHCDAMIVIGGRQSSNTAKLRDVCRQNCTTYLIETAEELSAVGSEGSRFRWRHYCRCLNTGKHYKGGTSYHVRNY